MLEDHEGQKTDELAGNMREAWVARTGSGNGHHNTLMPRWDFVYSY